MLFEYYMEDKTLHVLMDNLIFFVTDIVYIFYKILVTTTQTVSVLWSQDFVICQLGKQLIKQLVFCFGLC